MKTPRPLHPEVFALLLQYLQRTAPAWANYQAELDAWYKKEGAENRILVPAPIYGRFLTEAQPDLDWWMAGVARLREAGEKV